MSKPFKDKWSLRFINLAHHISKWCTDDSIKCGAVIVNPKTKHVVSMGYNGYPRGVGSMATKVCIEHAERNAIYNALHNGVPVAGYWMFFNWLPRPCPECAKAIIQSGIHGMIGGFEIPTGSVSITEKMNPFSEAMLARAEIQVWEYFKDEVSPMFMRRV